MQLASDNLTFQYPDSGTKVIDRLSFSMQGPGFNAVFGPSGVGKTSLARIISGGIIKYRGGIGTKGIYPVFPPQGRGLAGVPEQPGRNP